jgi:hypothetical protein
MHDAVDSTYTNTHTHTHTSTMDRKRTVVEEAGARLGLGDSDEKLRGRLGERGLDLKVDGAVLTHPQGFGGVIVQKPQLGTVPGLCEQGLFHPHRLSYLGFLLHSDVMGGRRGRERREKEDEVRGGHLPL